MKTINIMKTMVLSSLLSTSLLASPESDAYIASLLDKMYPDLNHAPTLVLTSATNQSINLDKNVTTAAIVFNKADIDGDPTTLNYLAIGDTTYFDIVKNDSNITVTLKKSISKGENKSVRFIMSASDGKMLSNTLLSTLTFTNPESLKTAPKISDLKLSANFTSLNTDTVKELKFDTNLSDTNSTSLPLSSLYVDSNDTSILSAILVNNSTIKLTRLKASSGNAKVILYATNSDGLIAKKEVNIDLPELNMPPYLAFESNNIVVYSSTSPWDVNISYGVFDYNNDFDKVNITDNNITKGSGYLRISGKNSLKSGESATYFVTVNAEDKANLHSKDQNITITVVNKNKAPVMSLPFSKITDLTQGDTSTKSVILYDENNPLSDLNVTLKLQKSSDEGFSDTNVTTSNLITVSDANVKIDFNKKDKTVTATTLQYNDGVTYTVSLSAKDPSGATTTINKFTLTTQSANSALIDSLIPVQMKDYSNSTCTPLYTYPDINMSDSNNFQIVYSADDTIGFNNFDFNSSLDLSTLVLNYDSNIQAYGAINDNKTSGVAIKFEISEAGQFSGGRMMCVFTDSNTSNLTCWALATPEQKVALDKYEANYCK